MQDTNKSNKSSYLDKPYIRWGFLGVLVIGIIFATSYASTATFTLLTTEKIKQQTTTNTPTLNLQDNWLVNPTGTNPLNATASKIKTTSGETYTTTGAPIWSGASGWTHSITYNGIVCNAGNTLCGNSSINNGDFALLPWISHGSYVQGKFSNIVNNSEPGLCLLCTNSQSAAEGVLVRLRRFDPGPGSTRWHMELGTVAASGVFTISPQTPAVDLGSPANNDLENTAQPLKLSYNGTTATSTITVNGTNYTATYTVAASYKTNTYLAMYSGRSNLTCWAENTFEAGYL